MVGSGGLLSLGGGAIIVGGVIAGTAEITYGGTVVAAASGNLGDDLDRLFRAIKSKGASGTNSFDLNNIDSFENAKISDVEKYLDNTLKGYTKAPLKRGTGVRYFDGKGNSYQLNY